MTFRDLSDPQAVLQAIAEFDGMGADAFRAKYGFGPELTYFVDHEGKLYDSKPIVAAAHGYQFGNPLANNFSGGDATIAKLLEGLGFVVTRPDAGERLPGWTRDELILALDAYLRRRGQGGWSKTTREAIDLSVVLRGWRSSRSTFVRVPGSETRPSWR
jgi:5-methylcytosine-specific restriction protein A